MSGAPFTIGQAQKHLSASRLGSRITFFQQDPIDFLSSKPEEPLYDVAVLVHCIWYFSSPSVLSDIFKALAKRAKHICIAEYALAAGNIEQLPHVLAVLAQASFEVHKPISESNVRTVLSMRQVQSLAEGAGLSQSPDFKVLEPEMGLLDGKWEVMAVLGDEFEGEVKKVIPGLREQTAVLAQREAVRQAVIRISDVGKVQTMDIYCLSFKGIGSNE